MRVREQGTVYYELISTQRRSDAPTNNFRLVSLPSPLKYSTVLSIPPNPLITRTPPPLHHALFLSDVQLRVRSHPSPLTLMHLMHNSRSSSVIHGRMSSSECGISTRIPIVLMSWPWMSSTALWTPLRVSSGQSGCLVASKGPLHGS